MKNHTFHDLFGQGLFASLSSAAILLFSVMIEKKAELSVFQLSRNLRICIFILLLAGASVIYILSLNYLSLYQQNKKFIAIGPYKYVRHPRYAALIFFIYPACAIFANSLLALLSTLLIYGIFSIFISKEEKSLIALFGSDYLQYRKKTPAFLPECKFFVKKSSKTQ